MLGWSQETGDGGGSGGGSGSYESWDSGSSTGPSGENFFNAGPEGSSSGEQKFPF